MHPSHKTLVMSRESFVEDPQRVDQIVRVDASALLKTIRELEYKLTEHQKSEKTPQWATALEQRIEQLENTFFQSQAKCVDANVDEIQTELSSGDLQRPLSPDVHAAPAEEEHHRRSVVDMAAEMRVINKVRKEIDNKFHTAENHLDTKMSSFNLQIDRLMKLLQIRPTTSELQTVMTAVYDVDKKVQNQMDEIKNEVHSTLKAKLSEEILNIIEEVNQSKDLSDSGIKYIQRTVEGVASELNDIREVTENTVLGVNDEIEKLRKQNEELEGQVASIKLLMEQSLQAQSSQISELKEEQRELLEQFQYFKNRSEEESVHASLAIAEEKARIDEEIARLDYAQSECNSRIGVNHEHILAIQAKDEDELMAQAKTNKVVQEALVDHTARIDKLRNNVDTLTSADFGSQIKVMEDGLRKTNLNLTACSESIDKYINGDLKTMNLKVTLLQEQCNIQIPNAYAELSLRLDGMSEQLISSNSAIDKLQVRIQGTDDTVGELMPLLDRATALEAHSKDHVHELASLKDGLTNTIDTTDELTRRIEEMEEGMEGLESSVTNRMNQMRDTLIDTVLEKQSETNNAMRNVRENLEVMSRVGDGPISAATLSNLTGSSGNKAMSVGPGASGKMSGGVSSKMNVPVQVNAPQQASFAAPSQASAKLSGAAGSRKQSSAANSGMRASISSEVDSFTDDFNDSFAGSGNASLVGGGGSIVGGGGSGSSFLNPSAMQGNAAGSYQRPSMVGQELRGTAPPSMSRQPSMSGVGMLSRHPSKSSIDFAPMSHQQQPQQQQFNQPPHLQQAFHLPNRSSPSPATNTPPPTQQHQQQQIHHSYNVVQESSNSPALQMTDSPDFSPSADFKAGDNSGSYERTSPRPSSGLAQRAVQAQQAMFQSYSQPVVPTAAQQQVQPRASVAVPVQHGQVRYSGSQQSQQQSPKYQAPPERVQQPQSVYSAESFETGNLDSLVPHDYQHFQQAQFLADLCLNFEEISVKRKRVANVPTVMCESIAEITQDIAEFMAKASDFEMVQFMLASVAGLTSASEINYDENMVMTKRNGKVEEYLQSVTNLIVLSSRNQQPGIVRLDARSLFVSLVKKSLDMFMSKHNQVLVVGNSRLGRVKIPSCVACDRPLIDKVRLDSVASRGGTRGELGSQSMLSHLAGHTPNHNFGGGGNNNNLSNVGSTASFGFGAPGDLGGGGSLLRGGESDEDEPPASSSLTLAPINNRKGNQSAAGRKRSTAGDGTKLPEVPQ